MHMVTIFRILPEGCYGGAKHVGGGGGGENTHTHTHIWGTKLPMMNN